MRYQPARTITTPCDLQKGHRLRRQEDAQTARRLLLQQHHTLALGVLLAWELPDAENRRP